MITLRDLNLFVKTSSENDPYYGTEQIKLIGKTEKTHDHEQDSESPEQPDKGVLESSQPLSAVLSDNREMLRYGDKCLSGLMSAAVHSKTQQRWDCTALWACA